VRVPDLDQLAGLSAEEAERRHFEAVNLRNARWLWFAFLGISFGGFASGLADGPALRAIAGAVNLAALVALLPLRRRDAFRRNASTLLLALLAAEFVLWTALAGDEGVAIALVCGLLPCALLSLRLRPVEVGVLVVASVAVLGVRVAGPAGPEEDGIPVGGALAAGGAVNLVAAGVALSIRRRQRAELLDGWARVHRAERDRARMREELEGARAIQLSMLPRALPALDWLELAAVCQPATEVGGDYYDFFDLGAGRVVVAVGDVAGHGVAAGLVLAGVRAGLHLLREELDRPERVLERLNLLVRDAGPERLLMTLGVAAFDRAGAAVRWISAGHPAALRWSARERRVTPLAGSCPPLGTRLPTCFASTAAELDADDAWLLVSDGALEARDRQGEPFGEARLAACLERAAAAGAGARAILDELSAEIDRHRAGRPAEDDLTLVVVRRIGAA